MGFLINDKWRIKVKTLALIGCGPRGISALEALSIEMEHGNKESIKILIFDRDEIGCGRIWKTNQNDNFIMNTPASHVTIFSEINNEKNVVYKDRPTLAKWVSRSQEKNIKKYKEEEYLPRKVYGFYLKWAFNLIISKLRKTNEVILLKEEVLNIECDYKGFYTLKSKNKYEKITHIVLSTGHDKTPQDNSIKRKILFLKGDSFADINIDSIGNKNNVFIKGLGLSFHDILSSIINKAGGSFKKRPDSDFLDYISTGEEPKIYAGSRSGLPIPARGINQKEIDFKYESFFLNHKNLNKNKNKDFNEEIYPLLMAELEHIYYKKNIENNRSISESLFFDSQHRKRRNPFKSIPEDIYTIFKLDEFEKINLYKIARPFSNKNFASQQEFEVNLLDVIDKDIYNSSEGNIQNPLKSALDVIRDNRDFLREQVEFSGITSKSFSEDFRINFMPVCSLLTAGPPIKRMYEIKALIESGILTIIGPEPKLTSDNSGDFFIHSKHIPNESFYIDTYIDGTIPFKGLKESQSTLLKNMYNKGFIRPWSNLDSYGVQGGIDIEKDSFRVISKTGAARKNIFCIGIPTENPRWFTQVGSGTANKFSQFSQDAKKLASTLIDDLVSNEIFLENKGC
tara:strand:+ start:1640 stop:3514 length:1875 start_codon:yes stop_codon:yes gene_type:complete